MCEVIPFNRTQRDGQPDPQVRILAAQERMTRARQWVGSMEFRRLEPRVEWMPRLRIVDAFLRPLEVPRGILLEVLWVIGERDQARPALVAAPRHVFSAGGAA